MIWKKFCIETLADAEEEVVALLMSLGIDALEVKDNKIDYESLEKEGGLYEELMPDLPTDDESARIIFYLEEGDPNTDTLLKAVLEGLDNLSKSMSIGTGEVSISISDEDDWRDNWKKWFHAFPIGDLLIKPTWEPLPGGVEASKVIEIDPGISFGTGQHETTKMCIEWLEKYEKPGDSVLDIGFGSGILSIAAKKLGSGRICGTDIDEDCFMSVSSNFRSNGLDFDETAFFIGDLANDEDLAKKVGTGYDIVLSNILADIIIGMKEKIYSALKPGGILIASGIIDFKEMSVEMALLESGFVVLERKAMGEWVSMVAKKDV